MKWFGKSWGAPVNADTEQAPVPVDALCFTCKEPISEGDRGFIVPHWKASGDHDDEPHHHRCFLAGIIGEEEYDRQHM